MIFHRTKRWVMESNDRIDRSPTVRCRCLFLPPLWNTNSFFHIKIRMNGWMMDGPSRARRSVSRRPQSVTFGTLVVRQSATSYLYRYDVDDLRYTAIHYFVLRTVQSMSLLTLRSLHYGRLRPDIRYRYQVLSIWSVK